MKGFEVFKGNLLSSNDRIYSDLLDIINVS